MRLAERRLRTSREVGVRGLPVGRHLAAFGLTVALLWYFWSVHDQAFRSGDGWNLWNKVFADTSVVLLCAVLVLGPLARFVPRVRRLVPWGRELGIAMFVTAAVHVVMLSSPFGEGGWIDHIAGSFSGEDAWDAANMAGWLAFLAALVLAATSNDVSHRLLGRGWKFVQRQAYTLFVLSVLHSVVWLEWFNSDWIIPTQWFWNLAALVVLVQFAGFSHTVLATRGPSPQRAPARQRFQREGVWARVGKWTVVVVLWGGMFLGPLYEPGSGSEMSEAERLALLCERYDELSGLPTAEIRDELMELVPTEDGGSGSPLSEWLELCEDV